jgi:hypothetical protein
VCEREWNQAAKRKNTLRRVFGVNAAVTARERVENAGAGICGGNTLRCAVRKGSSTAARRAGKRAALTDGSAAGVGQR